MNPTKPLPPLPPNSDGQNAPIVSRQPTFRGLLGSTRLESPLSRAGMSSSEAWRKRVTWRDQAHAAGAFRGRRAVRCFENTIMTDDAGVGWPPAGGVAIPTPPLCVLTSPFLGIVVRKVSLLTPTWHSAAGNGLVARREVTVGTYLEALLLEHERFPR